MVNSCFVKFAECLLAPYSTVPSRYLGLGIFQLQVTSESENSVTMIL